MENNKSATFGYQNCRMDELKLSTKWPTKCWDYIQRWELDTSKTL